MHSNRPSATAILVGRCLLLAARDPVRQPLAPARAGLRTLERLSLPGISTHYLARKRWIKALPIPALSLSIHAAKQTRRKPGHEKSPFSRRSSVLACQAGHTGSPSAFAQHGGAIPYIDQVNRGLAIFSAYRASQTTNKSPATTHSILASVT